MNRKFLAFTMIPSGSRMPSSLRSTDGCFLMEWMERRVREQLKAYRAGGEGRRGRGEEGG